MKLYCGMCKSEREEKEFTKFSKNPALADRSQRVVYCKDCASSYVEERGNTKEALKEILRLQDIPYIEKYAQSALESYKKKIKGTNLVIKRNVHSDEEEEIGIETNKLQTTIYTCYSSRIGLMPKRYLNFTFSDGLRNDEDVEVKVESEEEKQDKAIQSAIRYLKKTFGKDMYEDKVNLAKSIGLYVEELGLHKNNTNKRQQKFKLKNHISILVNKGILNAMQYEFILNDGSNSTKDFMEVEVDEVKPKKASIPSDYDMVELIEKWGDEYLEKDIVRFEKEYRKLVRNYEIKTESHNKFLKMACIASVRANESMAIGDTDGAKVWITIFKDMTSAGKLQPAQMSKADLSGGLNNFSEFYKSIEQSRGAIEIMPEFTKQPKDDADMVLWCMVQYVRRLKGLPDVEFKEIWQFYDEMARAFNNDEGDEIINDFAVIEDEEELEGDEVD